MGTPPLPAAQGQADAAPSNSAATPARAAAGGGAGAVVEWVWEPPPPGRSEGHVNTPHGPVLVVPPRGELVARSGIYPPPFRAPAQNPRKAAAAPEKLEYFPQWHVPNNEHPRKWEFPAYLDNPNCRWLQAIKGLYADPISFPASLAPEAGLLVHSLVRNIRPRLVIETGTFIGMSTLWIASALHENGDGGVVHAFDDFGPIHKGPWRDVEIRERRIEFVAGNIAKAGLADRVVLHPGNSAHEIRAAHREFRRAGGAQLAFLDADHSVVGVWQDLWATEPVLNTGGFVLFHDTFPQFCSYDGPRHLLDHINEQAEGVYEKVDVYLAPMNYGLGLVRRTG